MAVRYRPEVDGLRAVAVGAVVLYHAGLAGMSGGYVGVDVFFVISGYLITAILISDLARDRFSLRRFYERRARRILPALAVVVVTTVIVGTTLLNPGEYLDLARSVAATGFFAANVYFWQTTDYFGPAAEERPLLHMWSLAVEEQFYIAFPLFLLVLWRWRRDLVLPAFIGCGVVSLGLAELGWRWKPIPNFYLPTGRAWELLAGAVVAWHLAGSERRPNRPLAAVGLALILGSVFLLKTSTPYPSLWTAFPVAGTVLVILFADPARGAGRLLSLGPVVGLGLISYSVYLWHQPLFAFARVVRLDTPSATQMAVLVAASVLLGWATWRWVEQPFRRDFAGGAILPASAVLLSCLVAFGLGVSRMPSTVERMYLALMSDEAQERYALVNHIENRINPRGDCILVAERLDEKFAASFDRCAERYGKAVIFLGGSHAADMFGAVAPATSNPFIVRVAKGYCRPHRRLEGPPPHTCPYKEFAPFAKTHAEQIALVLYNQAPHTVFDAGRDMTGPKGFHPELVQEVVDYLDGLAADVPVLVLGPKEMLNFKPTELDPRFDLEEQVLQNYDPRVQISVALMAETFETMLAEVGIPFVSTIDLLDAPLPRSAFIDGLPTYYDWDHWSVHGKRLFGPRIVEGLAALGYGSLLPPTDDSVDLVHRTSRQMGNQAVQTAGSR